MDAAESLIALEMGDGVFAHGARLALRAVKMMGIEEAKRAAKAYAELNGSSAMDEEIAAVDDRKTGVADGK